MFDGYSLELRWAVVGSSLDGSSLDMCWIFAGSSLDFLWIVGGYAVHAQWISHGFSLDARWVFVECPLDIP